MCISSDMWADPPTLKCMQLTLKHQLLMYSMQCNWSGTRQYFVQDFSVTSSRLCLLTLSLLWHAASLQQRQVTLATVVMNTSALNNGMILNKEPGILIKDKELFLCVRSRLKTFYSFCYNACLWQLHSEILGIKPSMQKAGVNKRSRTGEMTQHCSSKQASELSVCCQDFTLQMMSFL